MIGKANRRNREVQVPPIHVGSDKIRSKRRSANGPTTRSPSALSKVATHPASHERHFLRDPFGAGFEVSRFRAELGHTQGLAGVATVDRRRRADLGTDAKGRRPPRPGSSANRAVARCALGRCRLGSANEPMMDATGKQERHPIGIDPPDQRPDAERGPVWGNDLQADYGPGAKSCSGHNFRAVIADVHDLAGVAVCPRFDDHRPGDSSSRMLPPISKFLTDHGLSPCNRRAQRNHREYSYLEVPDPQTSGNAPRLAFDTVIRRTLRDDANDFIDLGAARFLLNFEAAALGTEILEGAARRDKG